MQVAFSPRAQVELQGALDYHSDFGAADRFNLHVEQLIERMQRFPDSAQPRPDLTRRDMRFWFVAPFWFVTQRRQDLLLVVTVVHAARDLRAYMRSII